MKTDAIRECFATVADGVLLPHFQRGIVNKGLVELAALETALAMKDEALHHCISLTKKASADPNRSDTSDIVLLNIRRTCKAALSSERQRGGSTMATSEHQDKIEAQRHYCKEHGLPCFAHETCVNCGQHWTTIYTLDKAGTQHIMACPHCGWSWCD